MMRVITDGWASAAGDTLLGTFLWQGGKMNSLLCWRQHWPSFHPAIYSSGRARSQSWHSISFLFKSPISTTYQWAHECGQETLSSFDLWVNQSDTVTPLALFKRKTKQKKQVKMFPLHQSFLVSTSSSTITPKRNFLIWDLFGYIRFNRCEMALTQPILHCLWAEIKNNNNQQRWQHTVI